ncbi:MAG: Rho termination factor N-terminal domain-containing protein, partial [Acidobacteriota bacterium]|nr:Rho termination factor N-terminal domain-containing protein [Acidobacteriota bacterium]
MSVLDRETLEESTLADLHAIAAELSVDRYRRLRKDDLIDAIVAHQGGEQPA